MFWLPRNRTSRFSLERSTVASSVAPLSPISAHLLGGLRASARGSVEKDAEGEGQELGEQVKTGATTYSRDSPHLSRSTTFSSSWRTASTAAASEYCTVCFGIAVWAGAVFGRRGRRKRGSSKVT